MMLRLLILQRAMGIDLGEFQAEDGSMHHFKGVVDEKGQYVKMDG